MGKKRNSKTRCAACAKRREAMARAAKSFIRKIRGSK